MDSSEYIELYEFLRDGKIPPVENEAKYREYTSQFHLANHTLYHQGRKVIPRYDMEKYLATFHDHPTGAHFDPYTILQKMRLRYT